jgi:hypothetical protein
MFADAEIDTVTGKDDPIVIVIGLEVAGLPLTQARLDVRTQVTISLFAGA